MRIITFITCICILIASCDSKKLTETPMDKFIGTWKLEGRSMFKGITVTIAKDKDDNYKGTIAKLNENKYINMFAEVGDTWISKISRNSNFNFDVTEKKIGAGLFSLYGLSTSTTFKAEFLNDSTFAIAQGNNAPSKSSTVYKKIN